MYLRMRPATGIGVVALILSTPAAGAAQDLSGRVTVAATQTAELQSWGSQVDAMLRNRELVVRAAYDDRVRPELSHEVLAQHHQGVPVYGAELRVHRSGGVVMSILGSIYSGIDLDATATISAEQAAAILESLSDATLGPDLPSLMVFPIAFGGYALTYEATLSNSRTYILDAHDGHVRLEYSEIRTQTSTCRPGSANCAVGVGVGALGDQKKVSTTSAGGAFEARDSLRPAEYLTLDVGGNQGSFDRLSGDNGANPGFMPSDIARDDDNTWTDDQVVDVHAHVGWVNDYLFRQHGYSGIDDGNLRFFSFVNLPDGTADSNAFFSPPPSGPEGNGFMAYGEFDNGRALTALDVVGHEISHAVTFFKPSGNLVRFNAVGDFRSGGCVPGGELPLVRDGVVIGTLPADFNFEGSGALFLCSSDGRYAEVANVAGAVGEGFGDVIGASAEFFFPDANTPDYTVGEDFPGFGPIRSMENPASQTDCERFVDGALLLDQPCPDHFSGRSEIPLVVFPDGSIFYWGGSASDFGGEHINSTIFSHAYYLAIEGGTNRTSGQTVVGVGAANRGEVEEVFFSALIDAIPNSPIWEDVGFAILQTALIRFAPGSAVVNAVSQALAATGLL